MTGIGYLLHPGKLTHQPKPSHSVTVTMPTAVHHGAHMGLAMTILGHQSSAVTQKHYNQASMIGAVHAYQAMLLEENAPEEAAP